MPLMPPPQGQPLTAGDSQAIQTQQVAPARPSAAMLRKPKAKKKEDSKGPLPPGQQHWSQKPSAALLRGKK